MRSAMGKMIFNWVGKLLSVMINDKKSPQMTCEPLVVRPGFEPEFPP